MPITFQICKILRLMMYLHTHTCYHYLYICAVLI